MAQTRTNQVNLAPAECPPRPGSAGSRPDFELLYRRYRPDLVRYAGRRGADDPEGVADLALLDLARAFDRLRSTEEPVLRAYLYTATRNRARRDRACTDDLHLDEIEHLPMAGFEESVARRLDLDELLSKLSPNQEESLRLRFFHQLTSAETATVMEIDAATVRTHQRRGLIRLRRLVLATVVVAVVVVGLVAALRSIGRSAVRNDPIAPVEVPDDDGRTPQADEPIPSEGLDQVGPPAVNRFGRDPAEPRSPVSAATATTVTRAVVAPPPDSSGPTTSATSVIPVLPAPDTSTPPSQTTSSSTLPVLPPPDDPLATVPVLPGPATTGAAAQATTSSVVPVLPAPSTTEAPSTPSSSNIPVLPGPEVPTLPGPEVPTLPAPDDPSTDIPELPGVEQPTSATIPVLPGAL